MKKNKHSNIPNIHQDKEFPFLYLQVENGRIQPPTPAFQMLHWHEDLQLVYVTSGSVLLETVTQNYIITSGQAVIINRQVPHLIKAEGQHRYSSFVFPTYFIKAPTVSSADYFAEKLLQADWECIKFDENSTWQSEILHLLKNLKNIQAQEQTDHFSYQVLSILAQIWLIIGQNNPAELKRQPKTSQRLKAMINFIAEFYDQAIHLSDIAKSANISNSECLRCFSKQFQISPYQYLMNYRLEKARILLETSNLTISEIALETGFSQSSHFGKYFKNKFKTTPREYRKHLPADS